MCRRGTSVPRSHVPAKGRARPALRSGFHNWKLSAVSFQPLSRSAMIRSKLSGTGRSLNPNPARSCSLLCLASCMSVAHDLDNGSILEPESCSSKRRLICFVIVHLAHLLSSSFARLNLFQNNRARAWHIGSMPDSSVSSGRSDLRLSSLNMMGVCNEHARTYGGSIAPESAWPLLLGSFFPCLGRRRSGAPPTGVWWLRPDASKLSL